MDGKSLRELIKEKGIDKKQMDEIVKLVKENTAKQLMEMDNMYKAKVIEHEGSYSDGSFPAKIEKELNEFYEEGYELVSSNVIYEGNLLVILKRVNY